MTGAATCYVCGSAAIAADADPRSPTCGRCRPAREHVVSMQTDQANGDLLAVCPCGWRSRHLRGQHVARDASVQGHWLGVIGAVA